MIPCKIDGMKDATDYGAIEEALLHLWEAVNELSRIPMPEPQRFRVTIFGSARAKPGEPVYQDVRRLAAALARMGCDVVTGGGPGLMQAANEGAREGDPDDRSVSYGLPIQLPFEEQSNPFVERLFKHRTFFTRLHHFVRLSSAYVVMRGGIGSLLETAMVWQLLQVKHLQDRPLILVGEMWEDLVAWARRHMLAAPPTAGEKDLSIPICVKTVDECLSILREYYARFQARRV